MAGIGWRHPHYAQLLHDTPALSFLEVHSENFFAEGGAALAVLEQGRAQYPVSLHGVGLSLGSAVGLDDWHLEQLTRLVERIDPVRVSDHASFARGNFGSTSVHAADLLPIPFTSESLDVLARNIQQAQERLKRVLMVENLSSYLTWNTSPEDTVLSEPAFFTELVRRTGCQLLVDVNNIYVNALNAQRAGLLADPLQSCISWLDGIPAQAVAEIHLAGHCHVNDAHGEIVIDDHGSPCAQPVWDLYHYAIQRFGAVPTLLEWDTDIPPLAVLLGEAQRADAVRDHALSLGLA
jgi:uncharacterized protein (UPF0276 family)